MAGPGYLCDQCDSIEFNRVGDDWVCTNGHVQNWTIVSGEDYFA